MSDDVVTSEQMEAPPPESPQPSQRFPVGFGGLKGAIGPLITVLLAFIAGGMVVLATGHNPLKTYKAVWEGTGLQWFFQFGHHHIDIPFTHHRVFFWWETNVTYEANAANRYHGTRNSDLHDDSDFAAVHLTRPSSATAPVAELGCD